MSDITSVLSIENNKLVARSDVSVYGVLNAAKIQTTELVAHTRYDSQFFEFAPTTETGSNVGSGLLWSSQTKNKQFVFLDNPDRFSSTESIDIPADKEYMIGGASMLNAISLGGSVIESNLQTVGNLEELTVLGDVNFGSGFIFNSKTGQLGLNIDTPHGQLSIYDPKTDVEIVVYTDINGRAKIGTHHARSVDIITDETARISVEGNGDITIGQQNNSNTVTRVYGSVGVNVTSPSEDLEVSGNVRFTGKLFTVGEDAPASGSYRIGDIVWNAEPKPGQYIGWVCVATGNPGNWKPFGIIAQ